VADGEYELAFDTYKKILAIEPNNRQAEMQLKNWRQQINNMIYSTIKNNIMKKILCIVLIFAIQKGFAPVAQTVLVKANGITIAYESFGSQGNETILLISGTGGQLTMWPTEFCKVLANRGFRVIRFDNRDVGLSTKFDKAGMPDWAAITKAMQEQKPPPIPYTLDDMAADAAGLLDALKIKKAHIVGASMGGMIAQRVAYNHPDHVLSLASIMAGGGNATFPLVAKPDVVGKIPQPGAASDTAAYIEREIQVETILSGPVYPPNRKDLVERIKEDVKRSYYPDGYARQGAVSLAGFYAGRQDKLKTIIAKTVVIHGDEDPLVALEAGKDVAANIPGAVFEVVKGMGHGIPPQLYEAVANIIDRNAKKK
jgi:pimeloyl-ACP methyl ester carboxylesterase